MVAFPEGILGEIDHVIHSSETKWIDNAFVCISDLYFYFGFSCIGGCSIISHFCPSTEF